MSVVMDAAQDELPANAEVREHRLGVMGKVLLPKALVKSASDHGLDIKAARLKNSYDVRVANGKAVTSILPMLPNNGEAVTLDDLSEALTYLHQPLRYLSRSVSDAHYEEPDLDDVLVEENKLRARPENLMRSASSFVTEIDTSVAFRLQNTRSAIVAEEAAKLHDNLYRAIGFISRGSVQEEELHNGGHGDYDDHDDGCEVVAEDLEKIEAKKNASETSGLLLEGFRFSRKFGQYRLALHEDFLSGEYNGEAQRDLYRVLKDSLDKAKPDIDWAAKPERVYLSAIQLERFCDNFYARTQGVDADYELVVEDVLREEISAQDFEAIDAKAEELAASELLSKLLAITPEAAGTSSKRMVELSTALTVLQSLVDNPDMQGIWKKYNVTGRFFEAEDSPLEGLCADFERIQRVIDRNIELGRTSIVDLEAIAAEFRDTIAGGREILSILDSAIDRSAVSSEAADINRLHLGHVDKMLAGASLAPTTLPRSKMNEQAKEIAHYVGRHSGQEGIDPVEAIEDFVDDFGGEVVEFVKRNKVLTTALGLGFYFGMSAAAAQGGDVSLSSDLANGSAGLLSVSSQGFEAGADIADLANNAELVFTPMSMDDIERQFGSQAVKSCHFHLPVKVPYFEHCLFSDQTVKQLQDGYDLLKGPLSTVLDAPSDGMDLLAPRAEGEAPIQFVESFKGSLRATGDVWFVANGYQNLAHAPWAAVAGSMGYKLGALPAIRKTSGLITPLIDGAYGLAADNKYLLGNLPAIAYGYSEQGLSGGVMAAAMASTGAYAMRGTQRLGQQGLELLPSVLKDSLPDQVRYGALASSKIVNLSDYGSDALEAFSEEQIEEEFRRTGTGLIVPVSSTSAVEKIVNERGNVVEHPLASAVLSFSDGAGSFDPLPENLEAQLSLKVGGERVSLDLNAETYLELTKSLSEFAFLLEHTPEKLGVKDEDVEYDSDKERLEAESKEAELLAVKERLGAGHDIASKPTDFEYAEYLKRSVNVALDALTDYAKGEASIDALEARIQSQMETILGAKIVHLCDAGHALNEKQTKHLSIKGHQLERLFSREAARRENRDELAQTLFNAGRSVKHWRVRPVSMPLSLGFKAASSVATLGKMGVRDAWSAVRDDIAPEVQLAWNAIPSKVKGNLIGAGLLGTALAVKTDLDPQFAQAVQDTLPIAGEETVNALQTYSSASGGVAGASTATGLFMVYNFGEDHLIIHISMGYACIIGGAGARVAVYPLHKAGQIAEVLVEEVADLTNGYGDIRKLGRGAKRELQHMQRLIRDVKNYDQTYLPSLVAS